MGLIGLKLAASVLGPGFGPAQAQTAPAELKFASSSPPASPWSKQIDRVVAQIAEDTQGAVKVTPFPGSQLGSEREATAKIARGRLDMGSFTASAVALQVPGIRRAPC